MKNVSEMGWKERSLLFCPPKFKAALIAQHEKQARKSARRFLARNAWRIAAGKMSWTKKFRRDVKKSRELLAVKST